MRKLIIFFLLSFTILFPCSSSAKIDFPFKGQVDFLDKKYVLKFNLGEMGSISLRLTQDTKNKYQIVVNVDHFKNSFIDLTTELKGVVEVIMRENGPWSLKGNVWSQYSLINNKPSREFSGHFEIKDQTFIIDSIALGSVTCRGTIKLIKPYDVDLLFELTSMAMPNFLSFFVDEIDFESAGPVSGKIEVSGDMDNIAMKGQLESHNGFVEELEFESFYLNAQGIYPVIYINDSFITQSDGTIFSFNGPMNLADKDNFEKQIAALTKSPIISTDGANLEWTLKRMRTGNKSGKTELKYLLRKGSDFGSSPDSGMFGVKRSIEF